MKKTAVSLPVDIATDRAKAFLLAKNFTIFADIDHQKNAQSVDLEMPSSRVLIFGNPLGGTKLMQKDLCASLDLPLKLAIIEQDQQTFLLHHTTEHFTNQYDLAAHPVLDNIAQLFEGLIADLNKD